MSVLIPNTFVASTKAKASEVNANFAAIGAKFSEGAGGIKDEDISADAKIKRAKLSDVTGSRITEAQMENDAVDARVLKDDPNTGHPTAAVNTADHIKDRIITSEKLVLATLTSAELANSSVPLLKMAVTVHAVAFASSPLGSGTWLSVAANPTSTFPKATYELLAIYVKNKTSLQSNAVAIPFADDSGTNWAGTVVVTQFAGSSQSISGSLIYVFALRV